MEFSEAPKLPWMVDFHSVDGIPKFQIEGAYACKTQEYLSNLNIKSTVGRARCTHIFITINRDFECEWLEKFYDCGISGIRIRLQTFEMELASEIVNKIHSLNELYSRKIGRIIAMLVILEITGIKVRIGNLKSNKEKKLRLELGNTTKLTIDKDYAEHVTKDVIYVDYEKLTNVVQSGDKIIFDTGLVLLSATKVTEKEIECTVERSGDIISREAITIPGAPIDICREVKDEDLMLQFAIDHRIDAILMPNMLNKSRILEVANYLESNNAPYTFVLTEIDNAIALHNFDEICSSSDGISIDCSKLVLELPKEKVFLAQKSLIAKCNKSGTPVMLTTLFRDGKILSKSEISDLSNAIIDGVDSFVIPATKCSVEAVKNIIKICRDAEVATHRRKIFMDLCKNLGILDAQASIALCAVQCALRCGAGAIICTTSRGTTAMSLSYFRPRCPIIVISRHRTLARHLKLFRACDPLIYRKRLEGMAWPEDNKNRIELGITYARYMGYVTTGDAIVTVSEVSSDFMTANCIRVFYISSSDNSVIEDTDLTVIQ